jgi:hypothetical protein
MRHSKYFVLAALVAIAGCGSEPEPEQAAAAPAQPAPQPAQPAKDDPVARMARAVGSGKTGAAVELRYDMLAKPEVGRATQVEIALIPNVGVESLTATISGMDGVSVTGELQVSFSPVEQGKPYTHTFSLLPDRAGVYYLTVSVNSQMGGSSLGRTFSIPLVVGDVQTQQKARLEPNKDATGQAIESMKAEESR